MIEFEEWIRAAARALVLTLVVGAAPAALAAPADEAPADEAAAAPNAAAPRSDEGAEARTAETGGENGAATAPADRPPAAAGSEAAAGASNKGEGPDVFVPSEEISEDYAVSFPVDI